MNFVRSLAAFAHWTVGPPGIPEARLRLLRETYLEAMNDPVLLEAARRMAIPVGPVRNGERLAKEVQDSLDQPPDFVAFIHAVTGSGE